MLWHFGAFPSSLFFFFFFWSYALLKCVCMSLIHQIFIAWILHARYTMLANYGNRYCFHLMWFYIYILACMLLHSFWNLIQHKCTQIYTIVLVIYVIIMYCLRCLIHTDIFLSKSLDSHMHFYQQYLKKQTFFQGTLSYILNCRLL